MEFKNLKSKKLFVMLIVIAFILAMLLICVIIAGGSNKLQSLLNLGNKYLEEMDYDRAKTAFDAALEIDPNNMSAYVGIAEIYISQEQYEYAKEILTQGYQITEDEYFSNRIAEVDALNATKKAQAEKEHFSIESMNDKNTKESEPSHQISDMDSETETSSSDTNADEQSDKGKREQKRLINLASACRVPEEELLNAEMLNSIAPFYRDGDKLTNGKGVTFYMIQGTYHDSNGTEQYVEESCDLELGNGAEMFCIDGAAVGMEKEIARQNLMDAGWEDVGDDQYVSQSYANVINCYWHIWLQDENGYITSIYATDKP